MAKKNNNRLPPKINKNILNIEEIASTLHTSIYKTSLDFEKETNEDLYKIKSLAADIKRNFNKDIDDSKVINFWNNVFANKFNTKKKETGKKIVNISKIIEDELESGILSNLLASNSERRELYDNYRMIYESIPFLKKALGIILHNILSPNDFTKKYMNPTYKNISTEMVDSGTNIDDSDMVVLKNLKNLLKEHSLDTLIVNRLLESLKLGDQFVFIAKLSEEFDKFLNEDNLSIEDDIYDIDNVNLLSESETFSEFNEYKEIKESIENEVSSFKKNDKEFQEFVYTNYSPFIEPSDFIIDKNKITLNEASVNSKLNAFVNDRVHYSTNRKQDKQKENEEISSEYKSLIARSLKNISVSKSGSAVDSKKEYKTDKITGVYLETIDPEKVMVIKKNNFCYGYYVIEVNEQAHLDANGNAPVTYRKFNRINNKLTSSLNFKEPNSFNTEVFAIERIVDGLTKSIAKRIDKASVAKNPEFKKILYNIFKNEHYKNITINITYVPPNRMIHFKTTDDIYGKSIYASILFIAKIYLAILMNKFIGKVLRSSDRRVFYIEVGLDEDTESVVQGFVRDLKTKEFRMENYKSINNILNYPGHFSDYYIPKINGASPIEIDTLQGMEEDVSGDSFLEYLERLLLSGSDVPSAMLSMSQDELEFAKTLTID